MSQSPEYLDLPRCGPFTLTNVRVPASVLGEVLSADFEGLVSCDIRISPDGCFATILPAGAQSAYDQPTGTPVLEAQGRVFLPRLAEPHAHIDKTQTWERAPNMDGTFAGAKAGAKSDRRESWSYDDAFRRMQFALECAYVHGVRSLRTHIDSQKKRTSPSWEVFDDLRRDWSGRITLQGVVSLGAAKLMGPYGDKVADLAAQYGTALGPVLYHAPGQDEEIDRAFQLARDRGLSLDFHVDETLDREANGIERITKKIIDTEFPYTVNCGHVCALSMKPRKERKRILSLVREAGISLVALPMTNLYLQDRAANVSPKYRAMMPVLESMDAGVVTALGGDNCRDAFHPYGDYDMVEVLREGVRLGHLDHPFAGAVPLVSSEAEKLMGVSSGAPIREGQVADFILFDATSLSQVFARLGVRRQVVVAGRKISAQLPNFI